MGHTGKKIQCSVWDTSPSKAVCSSCPFLVSETAFRLLISGRSQSFNECIVYVYVNVTQPKSSSIEWNNERTKQQHIDKLMNWFHFVFKTVRLNYQHWADIEALFWCHGENKSNQICPYKPAHLLLLSPHGWSGDPEIRLRGPGEPVRLNVSLALWWVFVRRQWKRLKLLSQIAPVLFSLPTRIISIQLHCQTGRHGEGMRINLPASLCLSWREKNIPAADIWRFKRILAWRSLRVRLAYSFAACEGLQYKTLPRQRA